MEPGGISRNERVPEVRLRQSVKPCECRSERPAAGPRELHRRRSAKRCSRAPVHALRQRAVQGITLRGQLGLRTLPAELGARAPRGLGDRRRRRARGRGHGARRARDARRSTAHREPERGLDDVGDGGRARRHAREARCLPARRRTAADAAGRRALGPRIRCRGGRGPPDGRRRRLGDPCGDAINQSVRSHRLRRGRGGPYLVEARRRDAMSPSSRAGPRRRSRCSGVSP